MYEKEPAKQSHLPAATLEIIERLTTDPCEAFVCIHGDSPAVGIYQVNGGCVVFPGIETQALCPQHDATNGSIHGMHLVIDLTIDGAWSQASGYRPEYFIHHDQATDALQLVETLEA